MASIDAGGQYVFAIAEEPALLCFIVKNLECFRLITKNVVPTHFNLFL